MYFQFIHPKNLKRWREGSSATNNEEETAPSRQKGLTAYKCTSVSMSESLERKADVPNAGQGEPVCECLR